MVTVPLQVLVSMSGFPVHSDRQCKEPTHTDQYLYTVIDSVPSASGLTLVSKKGMDPSSLLSSTVNFMAGSTLFMC